MRQQKELRLGYEQQIFNVNTDAELKALITACVQAASKRNLKKKELYNAFAVVWDEVQAPIIKQMKIKKMDLTENEDQKEFRKKAEKFFAEYPENWVLYSGVEDTLAPITREEYTVNLWCAIYRMISEGHDINEGAVQEYLKNYILNVYEDREDLIERHFFSSTFSRLIGSYRRVLAMIKTNGVEVNYKATISGRVEELYETDFSARPKHYREGYEIEGYKSIKEMIEPKEFIAELFAGKSKTKCRTNIGECIWLIKNFF